MIQINHRKLTFEEYLSYEDNTDNCYKLIDGELNALSPESEPNTAIANYLFLVLVNAGIQWRPINWIIDPQAQAVTVLRLDLGKYVEIGVFQNGDAICSSVFPELGLTVQQVMSFGS